MFTLRNNNNFLNSFVNSRPSVLEASVFSGYNPLWPKVNFFKQLRYTHILSNVSSQNNSDLHKNTDKLNPWFVTGFTDGEGCFLINVRPNSKLKIGYSVELVFKIALHLKDKALVENIRSYFGVGTVTVRGSDCIQY
jgi:intein-encoded DNA endonuclease-like protein